MADMGSVHQRVGTDSQLPFGYCALSLTPVDDAVVSPSGTLYSREAILEYLLQKSRELKRATQEYEEQERGKARQEERELQQQQQESVSAFVETQDGVSKVVK